MSFANDAGLFFGAQVVRIVLLVKVGIFLKLVLYPECQEIDIFGMLRDFPLY